MASTRTESAHNTWWIVAVILLVQGFGSAVTELVRHSSFGVSGILVGLGAPTWVSWPIGVAGLGLAVWLIAGWSKK
ncbi:hypothetical protein JK358_32620 [Nocardia sp. 2]|uniref:Uncharacterized protein n=1 Tax=Nocardia acididurans TaxID=2802282 RepID=A0ABS1MFX2_9NOCA|nr:hypothetical protein [Nocardia acididurans]MBL1079159.1 hypothetical protein [Nocardia acididurans]